MDSREFLVLSSLLLCILLSTPCFIIMFKWLRKKKQKHSSRPDRQQPPITQDPASNGSSPAPASTTGNDDLQYPASVEDREDLRDLKLLLSRFPARCAGCSKQMLDPSDKDVSRWVRLWWEERSPNPAVTERAQLVCGLYCGRSGCGVVTCLCGSRVSAGTSSGLLQTRVTSTKV